MNGVVLVGRRPDDGHRDRLWRFCEDRWHTSLGWPIYEGLHTTTDRPEFCLSVASNRAAAAAGDWDVAIYIGADWIAGTAEQITAAATLSLAVGQLVFAHDRTVVLNEAMTTHLLDGREPVEDWPLPAVGARPSDLPYGVVHPNTFSGVLAVPRDLWQRVGGFDERFVGGGFEDLAFLDACSTMGGGFQRVEGAAIYHLWHPQNRAIREEQPFHGANQVLWERYRAARVSREAMTGGPRGH